MGFQNYNKTKKRVAAVLKNKLNKLNVENAHFKCVGSVKQNIMGKIINVKKMKIFKIGQKEKQGI